MRVGRYVSALAATTGALLAGIWLITAPWVLRYPRPASGWGSMVLTDFWTGIVIVVLAGLTFALYGRQIARAFQTDSLPQEEITEPDSTANPVTEAPIAPTEPEAPRTTVLSVAPDIDELLVPIATALLTDLVQRHRVDANHARSKEGDA